MRVLQRQLLQLSPSHSIEVYRLLGWHAPKDRLSEAGQTRWALEQLLQAAGAAPRSLEPAAP